MAQASNLSVYWLNPPQNTEAVYPDMAWMSFSAYASNHTWIPPIINWEEVDDIDRLIDSIVELAPSVLCISTYVWNYKICHTVAAQVKARLPSVVVIQGGPHQGFDASFFTDYPHVDYACYATAHGEHFIRAFLDQLAANGSITAPEDIPYIISRTHCDPVFSKRFDYPAVSPFEHNIAYLLDCVHDARTRGAELTMTLETTRGCPYSCTYCEWGGGTSSKVSIKPLELVKRELDLISTIGVHSLDIVDANFGMIERDVEIAEYLEYVKAATNSPSRVTLYGLAKTTVAKRERILDIFYRSKMMTDYFVAFQSISADALVAVKRSDISVEDNKALAFRMIEKYDAKPNVEFIMGLPGSTLDDFYTEMDMYHQFYVNTDKSGWLKARGMLMLLPDTPASTPGYMAIHGIKVVEVGLINGEEEEVTTSSSSIVSQYRGLSRVVVQTNTYTADDWKDMFLLNRVQRVVGPLLRPDTVASSFFRQLMEMLRESDQYVPIKQHLDKLVSGQLGQQDVTQLNGTPIERVVLETFVIPNRGRFDQSLDLSALLL